MRRTNSALRRLFGTVRFSRIELVTYRTASHKADHRATTQTTVPQRVLRSWILLMKFCKGILYNLFGPNIGEFKYNSTYFSQIKKMETKLFPLGNLSIPRLVLAVSTSVGGQYCCGFNQNEPDLPCIQRYIHSLSSNDNMRGHETTCYKLLAETSQTCNIFYRHVHNTTSVVLHFFVTTQN